MEFTEKDVKEAEGRMDALLSGSARAVSAHFDAVAGRVSVELTNGLEFAFPPQLAEGLANATPADLVEIEISPTGLGLHFPQLDADLYLPALLNGVLGSPGWMAQLRTGLGAAPHRTASDQHRAKL